MTVKLGTAYPIFVQCFFILPKYRTLLFLPLNCTLVDKINCSRRRQLTLRQSSVDERQLREVLLISSCLETLWGQKSPGRGDEGRGDALVVKRRMQSPRLTRRKPFEPAEEKTAIMAELKPWRQWNGSEERKDLVTVCSVKVRILLAFVVEFALKHPPWKVGLNRGK